jgi:hypothetical protein
MRESLLFDRVKKLASASRRRLAYDAEVAVAEFFPQPFQDGRAGKSFVLALIADYLAIFRDWSDPSRR